MVPKVRRQAAKVTELPQRRNLDSVNGKAGDQYDAVAVMVACTPLIH